MMVQTRKFISILVAFLLMLSLGLTSMFGVSQPVHAGGAPNVYYVTTATEFHDALDQAESSDISDVIYLVAGTYVGNFEYTPQHDWPLTISGEQGVTAQDVVLDGGDSGSVLKLYGSTSGISYTIEGITLRNGSYSGIYFEGHEDESIELHVNSVIIEDNTGWGGAGIFLDVYRDASCVAEIYNSVIRHNQATARGGGIAAHSWGGESSMELLMVNCLLYGNQAEWSGGGIELSASEVGDNNTTQATIVNSTISDNWINEAGETHRGAGINIYAYRGNGTDVSIDIVNSIVYGNTLHGGEAQDLSFGQENPGNVTIDVYACDIGDVLMDDDEGTPTYNSDRLINADPDFVDPAGGDYHLTPESPCIEQGTSGYNISLPQTDIEGNPRLINLSPDIGAYEFTGTPPESTIAYTPNSLNFVATEGVVNPPSQTLDIWNSGDGTLQCSVTDDALWLGLSPPNGLSTGDTDKVTVTVSVDISGMAVGNYDATITIYEMLASNTPQTVPVHLTINPPMQAVDEPNAAVAFSSIAPFLETAYGYRIGEGTGGWTIYNPSWPVEMNSLETLYVARGYWINVREACTLQYGSNTYVLDAPGWWLIGWIPQQ
ncbi:choice-of-anchor Q domain-containing protein [Chloroflexota bacterium]